MSEFIRTQGFYVKSYRKESERLSRQKFSTSNILRSVFRSKGYIFHANHHCSFESVLSEESRLDNSRPNMKYKVLTPRSSERLYPTNQLTLGYQEDLNKESLNWSWAKPTTSHIRKHSDQTIQNGSKAFRVSASSEEERKNCVNASGIELERRSQMSPSFRIFNFTAYRRTLSDNARFRCSSAEPTNRGSRSMLVAGIGISYDRSSFRGRDELSTSCSSGVFSKSGSSSNSRSASEDRFLSSSINSLSKQEYSVNFGSVETVAELAKNVASYDWTSMESSIGSKNVDPVRHSSSSSKNLSRQSSCDQDIISISRGVHWNHSSDNSKIHSPNAHCCGSQEEESLSKNLDCAIKIALPGYNPVQILEKNSLLTRKDELTLARAEARLAARRQARAEAREIRMKELEKQQKENDENAENHTGDVVNRAAFRVAIGSRGQSHSASSASYHSSRRSSEDSSEDGLGNIRDMRHELKELEEKFKKSMVQNAQLDNEKSALSFQVELLKDKIEDLEEAYSLLQKEHRDKCKEFENLKRLSNQIKDELSYLKYQLDERDQLIKEYGLVVVEDEVEVQNEKGEKERRLKKSLVNQESAQILSSLGEGSLDVRIRRLTEEKNELHDEMRRLKLDLEEERNRNFRNDNNFKNSHGAEIQANGVDDSLDSQREISRLADYKFKNQKYEQEIATLQANVARLEAQVQRYKQAAEEAESREDDLKVEKRKLQREYREMHSKLDELETTNSHLQKRLDKLKTAKSTLLKEL